ncbi:MAG TPA: aldose epimerase family protein [Blastocatellia bacterium]|nr:aldose epimerase family protein [Blastocatellia bacterium]
MSKENFGKTPEGQVVEIYTLTNANGVEARITTYGAIVVSLKTPDRDGKLEDIVLGFDTLDGYLKGHPYFGAIIGRFGNRIGKAKFTLNGTEYKLAANNGENTLHGGLKGFDKVVWKAKPATHKDSTELELTYLSKDGEEGFPGNLSVKVVYTLSNNDELKIDYSATTDKDTVVNMSSHSYFNLAGQGNGEILSHQVLINADRFTPVDSGLIPTGELRSVKGTPFDFTQATAIGSRVNQDDEQLKLGGGYDHNWVVNGKAGSMRLAARVVEPTTGRVMEVSTTEPGVQFYIGNFLDGTLTGKGGKVYKRRYGFCLETQHFPDSPNKPDFPSTVLKKGERYQTTTVFKFSTDRAKPNSQSEVR